MKGRLLISLTVLLATCCNLSAQFRDTNTASLYGQNLNAPPGAENNKAAADTTTVVTDTLQGFSLKHMVRGYFRKDTLRPGYLVLGSAIIPGASQAYNRQYWKIPLTYAGIGAGVTCGILANSRYQQTGEAKYKTIRTASYIGAGLVYWGQMLDGVVNFKTDLQPPVPAKSTIYSALLPGLGQACNGDWCKIPIWYGGFVACGYFYHTNDMEYKRFRYIYNMDSNSKETGYRGGITATQAEWYRDTYRRYRDYSLIAFILVYALNIIDANVFAHMADFDVSDNIAALEVAPTVITPIMPELQRQYPTQVSAVGLNMKLKF